MLQMMFVTTDNLSCMLDVVCGQVQCLMHQYAVGLQLDNAVIFATDACTGTIMLQRAQQSRALVALLCRGEGRGTGNSFAKTCHVDAREFRDCHTACMQEYISRKHRRPWVHRRMFLQQLNWRWIP